MKDNFDEFQLEEYKNISNAHFEANKQISIFFRYFLLIASTPAILFVWFGKDLEEFEKLLLMPEPYILYRFFFEDLGYTKKWWTEFNEINGNDKTKILEIVKSNKFKDLEKSKLNTSILEFVKQHYLISREDINNPSSKYYKEKQEYDLLKTNHPSSLGSYTPLYN